MKIHTLAGIIGIAMIMWIFTMTLCKMIEHSFETSSFRRIDAKQSILFRNR